MLRVRTVSRDPLVVSKGHLSTSARFWSAADEGTLPYTTPAFASG